MTKANTSVVAKLSVAFVAVAMLLTMVAPAKAATIGELQAMIAQLTAQLASLSGSSTTTTAGYTFTRSLTVGSQGADVTALQNYLISAGYPIAAGATGYFGAQTAAALAKWQAANGIAPAVGYFGPVSMAKYKSMVTTTTTTTTTTTSTVAGGAGSASVTNTSSDVEDEVDAGTSENIYGFKVEASDSDIKVTNVKLTFTKASDSASTYLNRYFESFDIVMDGETVATVDADSFSRDSSGVYSKSIALSNAVVKEGDKNTFYVVGHGVSTIDTANVNSNWSVVSSNLRYTDGTGAILTDSTAMTANSGININKLASSGDVKVKFSLGSANPEAGTVFVSDDVSGDKITLLEFKVKAEGTDIAFDQVKFTIATSGAKLTDMVSEFILYKGSTVIDTVDAADVGTATLATTTFDLDDQLMIDEDATVTYKLVAKMNKLTSATSSFSAGDSLKATLSSINAEDKNGDAIASGRYSGSAVGETQTVRGDGVNFAFVSLTSDDVQKTVINSTVEYGKFVLTFKVTADGDDFYVMDDADVVNFHLDGLAASLASSTAITSTATKSSGAFLINDGETETFTFTVETGTSSAATVKFIADSFNFSTTSNGAATSTQAFTPTSTWTSAAVILN